MEFPNQIIINDQDAWNTWHLLMLEGTYKELLKTPKLKVPLSHNWNDQDGQEVFLDPEKKNFESKSLSIPCVIHGDTADAAWLNYSTFINYIRTCGYFIMEAPPLNMQFKLLYDTMASMENPHPYYRKNGLTAIEFTLSLTDNFPFYNDTEFFLIDLGDGTYLADSDGEFIEYQ